jgi:hypothetical protein
MGGGQSEEKCLIDLIHCTPGTTRQKIDLAFQFVTVVVSVGRKQTSKATASDR